MPIFDLKEKTSEFALAAMITFFIAVNLIWFSLDLVPPMWDQSHYLASSENLFRILSDHGYGAFYDAYTRILGGKAPLVTVLPIPFFHFFGNTYQSALYVNLVFILICSIYLYRLASFIAGKKAALLSVFVLNTFPLAFAMSREVLVEYGLMTLVVAWMYHVIRLDASNRIREAAALGIVLGLGMLMKVSYIVYIFSPTVFLLLYGFAEHRRPPEHWIRNLLIVLVLSGLVAGGWYIINLPNLLDFVFSAGYGDLAKHYGTGEVFTVEAILLYWHNLINNGVSLYHSLLIFASILIVTLLVVIKGLTPASECRLELKYYGFILIWILAPFVLFTFMVNKDYRYSLPYYPALALLSGIALARLASTAYLKPITYLLLLFPLVNYLYISFSAHPRSYTWGPFDLLSGNLGYAHPPRREYWPNLELLEMIENDARAQGKQQVRVTLLFDHPYINRLTSAYYAANRGSKIQFETINYFTKYSNEAIIRNLLEHSHYIVSKSDKLGPNLSNARNVQIKAMVDQGSLPMEFLGTLPLPDETVLAIHRKGVATSDVNSPPFVLLRLGPSSTQAGEGFNLQPNGESAMWAQGIDVTPSTIVVFDHVRLQGFPSGEPDIITTPVPDELLATEGEFSVYLVDPATGSRSNDLIFQVTKRDD